MSTPDTLSAALTFLPNWWQETNDPTVFDSLLVGWGNACGWKSCGLAWSDENSSVVRTMQDGSLVEVAAPQEMPDALRRLRAGETTVSYSVPGSSGRVFALAQQPGRAAGVLWAERAVGHPWSEADRAYLALTARTMERSPVVAAVLGPFIDPERLNQRLGDAAVIAGRMAHDFDNILTGIIGFSDLAAPLIVANKQAAHFVAEIGKVGQRGIVFTQQLHHLSRSGQVKPNPGVLGVALAKEEARLKGLGSTTLRFEKDLPAGLPAVALEAGPLQTVIGHLLENAVEACPQGGLVRITARSVELSEGDARSYLGKAGVGAHLLVTVSDSGTGIKPEVRRRLFVEPFYTTKVRHRGLGLAIVYRVLCAHRGGIQIESVPAVEPGTRVRVVLPLASARPPAIAGNSTGHAAAVGNVSATAVGG